jgi:hypothetical protein
VQRLLREGRGKDDEAEVDGTPQAVDGDGGADSELKAVIAELGELRDLLKKAGKGS